MCRFSLLALLMFAPACDRSDENAKEGPSKELNPLSEYKRKSISGEARVKVKRMADDVQAYYMSPPASAGLTPTEPSLPPAAPMTPAAGSCCKQPKGRCAPSPQDWSAEGWRAIGFEVLDPHYYSYALEVDGDTFVAKAAGDLDCDGELSSYSLSGRIEGGAVVIDPDLTVEQELE